MSATSLTVTSQLRGNDTVLERYNFGKGKSATVFHDLDEFVTERMARFITGRHAQGRAERFRSGGQSQGGCGPAKDHQTEVTPVVTVEYSQPWLGFRGSVGEWWP
jgi:hypothetical protein